MIRNSDRVMSVWEHVQELRTYVFISLGAVLLGACITHLYHPHISAFLLAPLGAQSLVFLSPLDPLLFIFKIDFVGGILLALPIIGYCLFRFIAPAWKGRGGYIVLLFLLLSIALTVLAGVYTYVLLLPLSLGFLQSIQVPGIANFFTADRYIDFVLMQLMLMVCIFQIPSVLVLLSFTKLVNPAYLARNRGVVYVLLVIALSVLTPTTDLYTLALVLLPTLFIFEISLILGRAVYLVRTRNTSRI